MLIMGYISNLVQSEWWSFPALFVARLGPSLCNGTLHLIITIFIHLFHHGHHTIIGISIFVNRPEIKRLHCF